MKLKDLNPKLINDESYLVLNCPKCENHKIILPIKGLNAWKQSGNNLDDMTLKPSVWHNSPKSKHYRNDFCSVHFFITNGEIKIVKTRKKLND